MKQILLTRSDIAYLLSHGQLHITKDVMLNVMFEIPEVKAVKFINTGKTKIVNWGKL